MQLGDARKLDQGTQEALGTVKLTGVLRCAEERRNRLEEPVQARFEDWLIWQLLAQISVHDSGAHLQHQMSAAF